MTPREKWNAEVAKTLAGWRAFEFMPTMNDRYTQQLARSIVAGVIAKHLRIAYEPALQSLARLERDFAGIAQLASNRDPWAPKKNRPEAAQV